MSSIRNRTASMVTYILQQVVRNDKVKISSYIIGQYIPLKAKMVYKFGTNLCPKGKR